MSLINIFKRCKSSVFSLQHLNTENHNLNHLITMRWFNAHRASITKIRRKHLRLYPTLLVFNDGSTVTVRHHEPRAIIKVPLLIEDCKTDKEKQLWHMRRKPIEKIQIVYDDTDVDFDNNRYVNIIKKKSKI